MKNQSGFTLVEIVTVAGIIGILATLAQPKFMTYLARARQSEARVNLDMIYKMQKTYYESKDGYFEGELGGEETAAENGPQNCNIDNELGFQLTNCPKIRYTYYASTSNGAKAFVATATAVYKTPVSGGGCSPDQGGQTGIMPGCNEEDEWTIDQVKSLEHPLDGIRACIN